MKNYTHEEITEILKANNFGKTIITCPDGVEVEVSPCSYANPITDIAQCEYFLVYGDMPWMGEDNVMKLTDSINRHAEDKAMLDSEREKLRKYFDKHQTEGWDDESWSWYSDWHKDCYGYRPHGRVCGEYVEPYKGACLRF